MKLCGSQVSGHMFVWVFFLVSVCGTPAQNLSAHFSYIFCKERRIDIQSFQMICIQNKIVISQRAFITHIYGLHHYKGKL
jgi:hypothetical protein